MRGNSRVFLLLLLLFAMPARHHAQDTVEGLELVDPNDLDILRDDVTNQVDEGELDMSGLEELDDLDALKSDIGDNLLNLKNEVPMDIPEDGASDLGIENIDVPDVVNDSQAVEADKRGGPLIFDVGAEEKKLLEMSKFVENKIPEKEWNEIAASSQTEKYVVQEGDWLWKIAKTLFGSGFYYSKIWSLNPHITNPHEIEPGMVLVFETGDIDTLPSVRLGEFEDSDSRARKDGKMSDRQQFDFSEFGSEVKPPWLDDRKRLIDQGIFFQYASVETYEDLSEIGKLSLNKEYEKYEPPFTDIVIEEPGEQYDDTGFDKNSKIVFDVKEGFFLNSFVTSNIVQDLGFVDAIEHEGIFIQQFDKVYVRFDSGSKVKPGDLFSIYNPEGRVEHPVSDREGYRFTIVAQFKTLKKINDLWEGVITELSGIVERKFRVTTYTPKIDRILKTFSKRNIEAAVIDAYRETANGISFGDVVYIDRGRADGVELGTVFELYSFYDRGTGRRITPDPTYKIGELTVISITDDFATGLITNSRSEIGLGTICLTKTAEEAAKASRLANRELFKNVNAIETKALDELDVELNLNDLSKDMLDKADAVQLTEDELEELERQEREKSIIKDHEKDLRELDRLEEEIIEAENKLSEAKVDEDRFLEQQNLDNIENEAKISKDPNAFGNLNDIEDEIGRRYMDEDLNARENPYGLTEFDLEEIDELLNTETGE